MSAKDAANDAANVEQEEAESGEEEYNSDDDRNFLFDTFEASLSYVLKNSHMITLVCQVLPNGLQGLLFVTMSHEKKEALRLAVSSVRNATVLGGEGMFEAIESLKKALQS